MSGSWAAGWSVADIVTAAEFKKGIGSIYDTTLGGSAASVDVTGITGGYAHLLIACYLRGDDAASSQQGALRFNNDSGGNYDYQTVTGSAATPAAGEAFAQTAARLGNIPTAGAAANQFGCFLVFIPHYAGTSNNKSCLIFGGLKVGTATTNLGLLTSANFWRSSSAINRLTFAVGAGNLVAGSRVTIYGMGA